MKTPTERLEFFCGLDFSQLPNQLRSATVICSPSGVAVRLTIFIQSNYKMIEFTPKIINLENKMMSHEHNYLYNRSLKNCDNSHIFIAYSRYSVTWCRRRYCC